MSIIAINRFLPALAAIPIAFCCSVAEKRIWEPPTDDADELYRFSTNDRYGFFNRSGKVVINPRTGLGGFLAFSSGVLVFQSDQRVMALDTEGRELFSFPSAEVRVREFHEGLAYAERADGTVGFIDRHGKFLGAGRKSRNSVTGNLSDGLAATDEEGHVGYLDRYFRVAIERRYAAGTSFKEGVAAVVERGPCLYRDYTDAGPCTSDNVAPRTATRTANLGTCRWRFIDKTGQAAFPGEFEAATDFSEGLAAVKVKGKWGYVDRNGTFLIKASFDEASPFFDGLAWVMVDTKTRSCGFIDRSGQLKINRCYWNSFGTPRFSEGLAAVEDGGSMIYIDHQGRPVGPRFVSAGRFYGGLAPVQMEGKRGEAGRYGYIDRQGHVVFEYLADRAAY